MNSTIKQLDIKDGIAYVGDALVAVIAQREGRLFKVDYFFDGDLVGKNFHESSMENACEMIKKRWEIFVRKISNTIIRTSRLRGKMTYIFYVPNIFRSGVFTLKLRHYPLAARPCNKIRSGKLSVTMRGRRSK